MGNCNFAGTFIPASGALVWTAVCFVGISWSAICLLPTTSPPSFAWLAVYDDMIGRICMHVHNSDQPCSAVVNMSTIYSKEIPGVYFTEKF